MKKFNHVLEEGVETVMCQLNRSAEQASSEDEFAVKASHVTIKMQRKGDLFLQSVLNFNLRGGYLSKAIGRNRAGKYFLSLVMHVWCDSFWHGIFVALTLDPNVSGQNGAGALVVG